MTAPSSDLPPLAQRLEKIAPSQTLAMAAVAQRLKAEGIDVVSLAAGEPDFATPAHIQEALIAAMRAGKNGYTPTNGIPQLIDAIIDKFKADNGLVYGRDQVIVGAGAKNILYTLFQALVDPGDEVVICAPYWVSYKPQIQLNEGRVVSINTREADGFVLNPSILEKTLGKKTKAIVLNSPGNPTGAGYTKADLEAVADIALRHNLWIISDEIYEKIVFDGFEHVSIASLSPEVAARTIVVNGMSKSYAMTGWRLGYAAGDARVVKAMSKAHSQNVSNAPSIVQWAGVAALTGDQGCVKEMVAAFQQRKDYVVKRLNAMEGVECVSPKGAFYAFPRVARHFEKKYGDTVIKGSVDLATYLLEEARVSLVPGAAFGVDECIRMSFACGMDQLKEGLDRIETALAGLVPTEHYENFQVHLEQKRF